MGHCLHEAGGYRFCFSCLHFVAYFFVLQSRAYKDRMFLMYLGPDNLKNLLFNVLTFFHYQSLNIYISSVAKIYCLYFLPEFTQSTNPPFKYISLWSFSAISIFSCLTFSFVSTSRLNLLLASYKTCRIMSRIISSVISYLFNNALLFWV